MNSTSKQPVGTDSQKSFSTFARRFIFALFVLLILLTLMALTNPDREQFQQWLNDQLRKPSGGFLETTLKQSVRRQANYNIEYSDKFFFSTAQTYVAGRQLKFVGILGTWLPLP